MLKIDTLLTDSRSLCSPDSSIFFAISTSGDDGTRYIPDLYRRGVRNFVIAKNADCDTARFPDARFIVSDNVVATLQDFALSAPRPKTCIAVTGSKGKTFVKEFLFQLLLPQGNVFRSPGSYNSQIGVPLSIWQTPENTDISIIEAGVSQAGEMDNLAKIIRPDAVIITNILDDHDAGFASRREKACEKLRLAASPKTKLIIYNGDDPVIESALTAYANDKTLISWSFNNAKADLLFYDYDASNHSVKYSFRGSKDSLNIPISGDFTLQNLAPAILYLLHSGLPNIQIQRRLDRITPFSTRLRVYDGVNNCSLFHDTFTCDFASLPSALDFMHRRSSAQKRSTLILGPLLDPQALDKNKLQRWLRQASVSRLIVIGNSYVEQSDRLSEDAVVYPDAAAFLEDMSTSDFADEAILIKGTLGSEIDDIADYLEARKHETVLEVNLDAIVENYNYFRSCLPKGTGMIAMVKASAYGTGSFEIARTMQEHGAAYLAVAVPDEGIELRNRGISMPIMVMNPKVVNYKSLFAYRLEPEIYSIDMLKDVIKEARKNEIADYPIHLKLDTGMHRMGFIEEELPAVMDMISRQKFVKVQSVFTHLATADCPDMDSFTLEQLEKFDRFSNYISSRTDYKILRHALNSAGIVRFPQYAYDMARLGIGLYGVNTLPPEMEKPLANVAALRTMIIAIRSWNPGETIGYGRRGVITRPSRIATIPIGYADGMNRRFGNGNIHVLVNGCEAPTIGNICMDACMIDVTDIDCRVGDEVEIFGPKMPIYRLAELLDTIPYEVLTSVSPRVKRIYYR